MVVGETGTGAGPESELPACGVPHEYPGTGRQTPLPEHFVQVVNRQPDVLEGSRPSSPVIRSSPAFASTFSRVAPAAFTVACRASFTRQSFPHAQAVDGRANTSGASSRVPSFFMTHSFCSMVTPGYARSAPKVRRIAPGAVTAR